MRRRGLRVWELGLALLLATGCELELDPEAPPESAPFGVTATNVAVDVTGVPRDQTFTLTFNRYLDPSSFRYFDIMSLRSGGLRTPGFARYRVTTRSLTFYPTRLMEPELIHQLVVDTEILRSLEGEAIEGELALRFQTGTESESDAPGPRIEPVSFAADVEPLFQAGCSCHYDRPALVPLTYERLVGQRSEQMRGRALVEPFDPARSYLLQKLLADYPDRRFDRMPPAWSDEEPLGQAALERIEDWIETGARE